MGTRRVSVEGVLTAGHKDPAVEVPFDPATELGAHEAVLWPGRRGFAVEVLLNGIRFRSAIVSRMRRFFVLVDESLVRRAGSRVGARVRLTLWADGPTGPAGASGLQARPAGPVLARGGTEDERPERAATGTRRKRSRSARRRG
ncbi:MAG TPA: DUF1905 domain-containing protein [Vicinamibacteria bacterium]|nr:DUF1905 domain-containing protein [Vicinamibacteria bacterium]